MRASRRATTAQRHARGGRAPLDHVLARRDAGAVSAPLLDFRHHVGLHVGAAAHETDAEDRGSSAAGHTLNARLQVRGFDAIAQLVEAGPRRRGCCPRPACGNQPPVQAVRRRSCSTSPGRSATTCSPRARATRCRPRCSASSIRCALPPMPLPARPPSPAAAPARFPKRSFSHDRTNPLRQALGRPRRPHRGRRHRRPLHRPPPAARGHQPAGVRGAGHRRPQGQRLSAQPRGEPTTTTPTTGWEDGYDGIRDPISRSSR